MNNLGKENIKTILDKVRLSIISSYKIKRNQNRSFTIISNDGWGTEVYIDTNIQYLNFFVD